MKTVTAIIAGAPIQLATRFEVRRELTKESTTPIRIAAGTPRNRTARKVKVSLAVKLELVLGMRIGLELARITKPNRPANIVHCAGESERQRCMAHTRASAPAMTMAIQ